MIRLDITTLVFFYILFSTIIILIAWAVLSYRRIKDRPGKDIEYIWKCSVCFHTYIDSRHEDISACPLCGSYNKKILGGA
jgi:DNA-directed RNA polymerase subunit RPC12/RpoP